VSHLPLISTREGKRVVHWPVLLARFAVYMLIFGSIVFAVTWVSDWIFHGDDHRSLIRMITFPLFLTIVFLVSDARRDASTS
jgi:hypothetical protein